MVQAQLRAPLGKGHAEIATEQPGQGAFAGADLTTELSQRPIVCRIGLEDRATASSKGSVGVGKYCGC